MSHPAARSMRSRRSFLRHVSATAAAAFGVLALPRSAGAATAEPAQNEQVDSGDCTVYCYMVSCPCPDDLSKSQFRCISRCGWETTVCYRRSCTNFCLSQEAC